MSRKSPMGEWGTSGVYEVGTAKGHQYKWRVFKGDKLVAISPQSWNSRTEAYLACLEARGEMGSRGFLRAVAFATGLLVGFACWALLG